MTSRLLGSVKLLLGHYPGAGKLKDLRCCLKGSIGKLLLGCQHDAFESRCECDCECECHCELLYYVVRSGERRCQDTAVAAAMRPSRVGISAILSTYLATFIATFKLHEIKPAFTSSYARPSMQTYNLATLQLES